VSGRLRLRRGVVVDEDPLTVEIGGERRRAWADPTLLGEMRKGDEVIVNVAALDLDLGSGGFDVVHVNLTRGLDAPPADEAQVMKLNYTSLQHPVDPVEPPIPPARRLPHDRCGKVAAGGVVVGVLPLHGHLAPVAWALAGVDEGLRVAYVQTGGGALPGSLSRDVAELHGRGLLCAHVTAAPAYGGELEALSTIGALDAAVGEEWDVVLVGPGPGIIGSETEFGHGGTAALDSAHAALALGLETVVSPRLSSSDPRPRHQGLSHHTATVLESLLAPVEVVVPVGSSTEGLADLPRGAAAIEALSAVAEAGSHRLVEEPVDLDAYAASGLPARTMGRSLSEDPLFFAAPLAAGARLAAVASSAR
jgi:Protein of unknown function (DUF3866)